MVKIRNTHIQNYLSEHGVIEEFESLNGNKHYKYTKHLHSLLDKYYIEFMCIPNKL